MIKKFPLMFLGIIIFSVWVILQSFFSFYPDLLWFENLGFTAVFWTSFWAKVLTGSFFFLFFFIVGSLNILVARHLGKDKRKEKKENLSPNFNRLVRELLGVGGIGQGGEEGGFINVTPEGPAVEKRRTLLWLLGVLAFSILIGISAAAQWQVFLKAFNAVGFGISDPVFGLDIGFYVFNLPLQKVLQGFLFSSFLFSFFAAGWIYFTDGNVSFSARGIEFGRGAKAHLGILLSILALIFAWGLYFGELGILYSSRGVVFGAGYSDVKAQLFGYNAQIFVMLALSLILAVNVFQKDYRLPLLGFAVYLMVAFFAGGVYPTLVQNFHVKPNEISLEAPYIENAIKYTRLAYGLDEVEEKEFAADQELGSRDLQRNAKTIGNIRLWDPRPLLKTYRQLQGIRLYYNFSDVDIDRYQINGTYQQVMLSAREMNVGQLPEQAKNWINEHLKFTHGYGVCLSPVNEQTPEGLPRFFVKDIPPIANTNIKIKRPEIYYGEETGNYVIVNTKEQEFDYPKGDKNVYASYAGQGGVKISSFLRRLAFAMKFGDSKILLTDYITPQSRLMFDRNIRRRVTKIAPFLAYDRDPYIVISDDGRLYWIQDAYTVSDLYPYSSPSGTNYEQFNYIRNSVKVVVDAYQGTVDFYLLDKKDPLASTFAKIYPSLFKPLSKMPADLKKHLRYPYDLFMVQAQKYATYHMQDPQVYYNREDLWHVPKEIYDSSEQGMDAYYVTMKLPGQSGEEFILMLPFTPNNKDNMIAWLSGRSDGENYGKLLVYKFPKEKLIYGPRQIEARIDQQTEISQQFTLWGQVGSRVIRGNLLAIPIEESILYVEPIYLEASSSELPELKRVIAAYGKNVAMEETLDQALSAVFSGRVSAPGKTRQDSSFVLGPRELAKQALDLFNKASSSLKTEDFGNFGEKWKELKQILQKLAK